MASGQLEVSKMRFSRSLVTVITAVRVYDHIINGHEQSYQSRPVMPCRRGVGRARRNDEPGVNYSFSMYRVRTRTREREEESDKMLHLTSSGIFALASTNDRSELESNTFVLTNFFLIIAQTSRLAIGRFASGHTVSATTSIRLVKTFTLLSAVDVQQSHRIIPDESQLRTWARKLTCLILIERIKWFIHAC